MRSSFLLWLVIPVALAAQTSRAREPVIQSVDLMVPYGPVTFPQEGRAQLVHELHITNFRPVDASLTAIRIVTGEGSLLAEYKESDLRSRVVRPGLRSDHATPLLIAPGMRAVVTLWISLPPGEPPPTTVRHVVELDLPRADSALNTTVEGTGSQVLRSVATLGPPLRGGPWVAIYDPLLRGGHRSAFYTLGGRARIPGRFAIDFIRLPAPGFQPQNPAVRPVDWNGLGSDVLAVAGGRVVAAVDGEPDDAPQPVAPERASGNYVAIAIGAGRFAFYEHLQRGSVAVKAGQRVQRGQVLGKLGSSGSTSIGPHLHFHVADTSETLAAEGLPFVFGGFVHLGAYPSIDALTSGGQWSPVSERQARGERPGPLAVLKFLTR